MFLHNRNPHQQGVSAVDERRKEETMQSLIDVGIRNNVRKHSASCVFLSKL